MAHPIVKADVDMLDASHATPLAHLQKSSFFDPEIAGLLNDIGAHGAVYVRAL